MSSEREIEKQCLGSMDYAFSYVDITAHAIEKENVTHDLATSLPGSKKKVC